MTVSGRDRGQKNDHHIYLIMAFSSGGDLSIYIKKRGRLPTLDFPRLLPDGTKGEMGFWPHPDEGGLDASVTRCFLGQLSGSSLAVVAIIQDHGKLIRLFFWS